MKERLCAFFNPMYLQGACSKCLRWTGVVCGSCPDSVCRQCHAKPTLWQRLKLALLKKGYGL